ncbi:hypothetical protein [Paraburkholderia fungorum]|uniref:hypothetical protein n=1 Tax=Paraburkholderia fungorum TaxID=134537 RepID=UPI000D472AE2|nr:hypothetical protein [Paraburkholderia fungorum]PRZ48174.1 hypothetical protein BX589_128130 [Paraburkholderia fungorum]
MNNYTVTYEVTSYVEIEIEAEDEDDAYEVAKETNLDDELPDSDSYDAQIIRIDDENGNTVYED